jgi:hypothetical protein
MVAVPFPERISHFLEVNQGILKNGAECREALILHGDLVLLQFAIRQFVGPCP